MHKLDKLIYAFAVAASLCAGYAFSANQIVSQKGRTFLPGALEIAKGESITIINDDEFLHHAFIKAPDFEFDSGGQEIGSSTVIRFTKSGVFDVLCAIHPKMKLTVTVH